MKALSQLAIDLRDMQKGTMKDVNLKVADALLEIDRRLSEMELNSKSLDLVKQHEHFGNQRPFR